MLTPEAKEKLYEEMKALTNFSSEDVANLASLSSLMKQYSQPLTEKFYGHLHNLKTTKKILQEETGRTQKLKSTLINWFENLFVGNYDQSYANDLIRIGSVHVLNKIDQRYVLSMYGMLFQYITAAIEKEFPGDSAKIEALSISVGKILSINMALMMETYINGLVDSTGWSMELLKNIAAQSMETKMNQNTTTE